MRAYALVIKLKVEGTCHHSHAHKLCCFFLRPIHSRLLILENCVCTYDHHTVQEIEPVR